ncbi:pro-sigmaK processing inhibitor BofA family protein [Paenibacillus sediminis]|uniref:Inhibitor of the pro-sigma K processing machinery n=1 Tax=Paenibacillus sediminis TaxID=664909 RepID=A0ABS4H7W1_9BACL|nr:pro-sigmaK processing inhibitor BofA family protein [Paenibacillus sediminis]MBP1938618.1 inhibitor of the pro-sigma K processing machinery [Paenibacillus sediminis]
MKLVMTGILVVSFMLLIYILIRKRIGLRWFTQFGSHIVLAALAIYVLNFSGLVTDMYIPLNPITVSTAMVLGVPGVALLLGLKLALFG